MSNKQNFMKIVDSLIEPVIKNLTNQQFPIDQIHAEDQYRVKSLHAKYHWTICNRSQFQADW